MSVRAVAIVPQVRPPRAIVARGLVDIRAAPAVESELVDQAWCGETVTILGSSAGWVYVQGEDGYFGWTQDGGVGPSASRPAERVVVVHGAVLRAAPEPAASVVDAVMPGTPVAADTGGGWLRCGVGWIARADTAPLAEASRRPPTAADLLATAETYLGTPYLWGGVSARGIDCSGLTQQVYRLNGVALPRDADQQALAGRPVDAALPGDLFFFGDRAVTHTAIATGPDSFLHAPLVGGFVEHRRLTDARPPLTIRAIRRYLP